MSGTMFDVPSALPTDLQPIPHPLYRYRHEIIEVSQSRQEEQHHFRHFSLVLRILYVAALRHFNDLISMEGSGMDHTVHRPVDGPAGTSNIVPGMPRAGPGTILHRFPESGAP